MSQSKFFLDHMLAIVFHNLENPTQFFFLHIVVDLFHMYLDCRKDLLGWHDGSVITFLNFNSFIVWSSLLYIYPFEVVSVCVRKKELICWIKLLQGFKWQELLQQGISSLGSVQESGDRDLVISMKWAIKDFKFFCWSPAWRSFSGMITDLKKIRWRVNWITRT